MSNTIKLAAAARPAAPPLDTPTDLSPEGVAAICEQLNLLIPDGLALYLKTKNFHWHVSGPHFRDYHLLLDEQGDRIVESIDPIAERVRKLGGETLRSISHVSRIQTIKDNNDEFVAPLDMLRELMADNKQIAAAMRKCHETADKYGDGGTSGVLETLIDETEKRIWFLFEASRPGDKSGH
ncbi:MAG TPA: DNA starvation/stationary phase protection protein [Beijerinckia sp.]|jgi:starvation-inducible DNA-binding protein|nr:DNA starvation/stationary phase protection protein [Beijerinckia sp.]